MVPKHNIAGLAFVLALMPAIVQAEADPAKELKTVEEKIQKMDASRREMEAKEGELREELESLQKELVELAAASRANEKALSGRERELLSVVKRSRGLMAEWQKKSRRTSQSMSGMVRFSQMPPEAWIALPGTMNDAMRAAVALRYVTMTLHDDAKDLREDVQALDKLKTESEGARLALEEEKRALEQSKTKISEKLSERKKLHKELNGNLDKTQREIAYLSARARSLRELIETLEARRSTWDALKPNPLTPKPAPPAFARAPQPESKKIGAIAKGKMLQPATGDIVAHFGDAEKDGGGKKQGVEIHTRDSAQVVAPFDGEVVYTGPFLSYGNIVIIRHSDEYHTLIAGLKAIHSEPGQFVLQGEPVGKMGQDTDGLTKLYIELRKNSSPIDPLPWMSG